MCWPLEAALEPGSGWSRSRTVVGKIAAEGTKGRRKYASEAPGVVVRVSVVAVVTEREGGTCGRQQNGRHVRSIMDVLGVMSHEAIHG